MAMDDTPYSIGTWLSLVDDVPGHETTSRHFLDLSWDPVLRLDFA